LEYFAYAFTCSSRTFEVFSCADFVLDGQALDMLLEKEKDEVELMYLLGCDGTLVGLSKLFYQPWVASEILLAGDENYRETTTEVSYF
jgi:hypothetical protein